MKMMKSALAIMSMMLFAQLSFADMPADKQTKMANKMQETQTAIGITAQQQGAWDAYKAAMMKRANMMYDAKMKMKTASKGANATKGQPYVNTASDRLKQKIDFEQANLDSLKGMQPALDNLYKALTPAQQKIADQKLKIK